MVDPDVDPDGMGNVSVSDLDIPAEARRGHLLGYGFIFVFRIVACHGDTEQARSTEQAKEQVEH